MNNNNGYTIITDTLCIHVIISINNQLRSYIIIWWVGKRFDFLNELIHEDPTASWTYILSKTWRPLLHHWKQQPPQWAFLSVMNYNSWQLGWMYLFIFYYFFVLQWYNDIYIYTYVHLLAHTPLFQDVSYENTLQVQQSGSPKGSKGHLEALYLGWWTSKQLMV